MSAPQSSVSVSHISKSYGDFAAVKDLSLEVAPGSIFGLLGPNGAGKSTTIRMIVNITMPDSGEVKLFGERMTDQHQERVGYLPEDRGLYKKMKVGEQLEFFAALKGVESKTAKKRIAEWLDRVNLTEWKNKKWEELSKGMQQKVQFVSTILHDPDLVILDEPFSGLDPINANLLKDVVHEMKERGKTIIFSTHLMEQAEQLCDSICLINRGHKVIEGKLREVKRAFLAKAKERIIALDAENYNGLFDHHELVKTIVNKPHHIEITLQENADSQALLKDLVTANVRINRFELIEPTLNEIFIQSVGAADAGLLNN